MEQTSNQTSIPNSKEETIHHTMPDTATILGLSGLSVREMHAGVDRASTTTNGQPQYQKEQSDFSGPKGIRDQLSNPVTAIPTSQGSIDLATMTMFSAMIKAEISKVLEQGRPARGGENSKRKERSRREVEPGHKDSIHPHEPNLSLVASYPVERLLTEVSMDGALWVVTETLAVQFFKGKLICASLTMNSPRINGLTLSPVDASGILKHRFIVLPDEIEYIVFEEPKSNFVHIVTHYAVLRRSTQAIVKVNGKDLVSSKGRMFNVVTCNLTDDWTKTDLAIA